jgi:hypothetical protein
MGYGCQAGFRQGTRREDRTMMTITLMIRDKEGGDYDYE